MDAGKPAIELVPNRQEALAVSVARDVEEHKDVGVGVVRRVDEMVKVPRPDLPACCARRAGVVTHGAACGALGQLLLCATLNGNYNEQGRSSIRPAA